MRTKIASVCFSILKKKQCLKQRENFIGSILHEICFVIVKYNCIFVTFIYFITSTLIWYL